MMSKLFPKTLFLATVFCLLSAANGLTAFAQPCEGVYFKPAAKRILAEKVAFIDFDARHYKDLTGDGKIDLLGFVYDAATNQYTKIYILPGTGAGDFGAPIQIQLSASIERSAVNLLISDFNSDGKNDFVVRLNTNPPVVVVYQNNGSGAFTALAPTIISSNEQILNLVDANGDNRADLFGFRTGASPESFYRLANPDGSFGASVQLSPAEYRFSADFNGDGKVDFPVVTRSGSTTTIQFYLNLGNGVFTLSGSLVNVDTAITSLSNVADFNNDGKSDLLFNSSVHNGGEPRLVLLLNLGNGNFSRTELNLDSLSSNSVVLDFNGDGFLDILAISGRPNFQYRLFANNGAGGFTSRHYAGRLPGTPVGDLDGDNKADFILISSFDFQNNSVPRKVFAEIQFTVLKNVCNRFGQTKIIDFDGDGFTDTAFWRESDGRWRYQKRNSNPFEIVTFYWGQAGDVPVPGDYDGDARTDYAVFRPSTGAWYFVNSSNGSFAGVQFGATGDRPVASDYNGDGRTDIAVYRPSTGVWYVLTSGTNQFYGAQFGTSEDKPVPEDYDADGKTDFAVFRPSTGTWYVLRSSDGSFFGENWGTSTDALAPADYDGDGRADLTVFRSGTWYIRRSNNLPAAGRVYGLSNDIVQPSDWDGDNIWDLGVYRPSDGNWYTRFTNFIIFPATGGEVPISSLNKNY